MVSTGVSTAGWSVRMARQSRVGPLDSGPRSPARYDVRTVEAGMIARSLLAACLLGAGASLQDTVELESGKTLEGRVVYEDDQVLVLRRGSRDREIDMADVVRLT